MAGHPHAPHDRAGEQALTDRARAAMPAFGAVCAITTGEPMTFHDALEPAALRNPDRVDVISRSKQSRAKHVARLHFFAELAKLLNPFHGGAILFLDVAEQRLGHALLLLIVEPKLNGVVAVALLGLALQHAVGSREHNRHRRDFAFRAVNARLAQFLSK